MLPAYPTAQQSDAEAQATEVSRLFSVLARLGELTTDHAVPFQRSIKVWATDPGL
jgi:hypothetical protein